MAMRFLSACALAVSTRGEAVSGFANTVEYQFASGNDANYFLGLMQPFASYVRDNEQALTHTFRTFLKEDGLSVLLLERFVNKTAHDGPHLESAAHDAFAKEVSDWNATSGAIVGKLKNYWYETELGTFLHGDARVSGFALSVVYSFGSKDQAQQYLAFLQPLAAAVAEDEAEITDTFRPFLSDDGLSVLLFERFVDRAAHDGPHKTSAAHDAYAEAVAAWNASTGAVLGKVHKDWYETHQGVIGRVSSVMV